MHILQVTNLGKKFDHQQKNGLEELALEDITFSLEKNDFLTFVGVSGCGKTTLLKCLAGLTNPSWGKIQWNYSIPNSPLPPVILVFQDYSKSLLPWRTVLGNVIFPLENRGDRNIHAKEMAMDALIKVGLGSYKDSYPRQLSGGMQQRLQIARAIACNPKILLLDEPFSALDALTKTELYEELRNLQVGLDLTILMVTHDVEEAIYLSNRIIVLSRPARIIHDQAIDIPKTQRYIETKADPRFAALNILIHSKITKQ